MAHDCKSAEQPCGCHGVGVVGMLDRERLKYEMRALDYEPIKTAPAVPRVFVSDEHQRLYETYMEASKALAAAMKRFDLANEERDAADKELDRVRKARRESREALEKKTWGSQW